MAGASLRFQQGVHLETNPAASTICNCGPAAQSGLKAAIALALWVQCCAAGCETMPPYETEPFPLLSAVETKRVILARWSRKDLQRVKDMELQ